MLARQIAISPLCFTDIPAAVRLSTQAGWNQIEADWLRLLHLWPNTALGAHVDGQLIATATLATFAPDVGWIGMLLVDQSFRRQGVGRALFKAVLDLAHQLGIARLGLDATDLGEPLYTQHGFIPTCEVRRYRGFAPAQSSSSVSSPLEDADWPHLIELDRRAIGIDRARLLRHLASERGASVRVIRSGPAVAAFALSRPGREHYIGPVIAADPTDAVSLIGSLAGTLPRGRPVLIDVACTSPLTGMLPSLGFSNSRRLSRMLRPVPLAASPLVHSPASLELG